MLDKKYSQFGHKAGMISYLENIKEVSQLLPQSFFFDKSYFNEFLIKHPTITYEIDEYLTEIKSNVGADDAYDLLEVFSNYKELKFKIEESFNNWLLENYLDLLRNIVDDFGNSKLAVRSSGLEDLDGVANAGGNLTLLNVECKVESISKAVSKVITSYFDEKSLLQVIGESNGISILPETIKEMACPVLIQEMIGINTGEDCSRGYPILDQCSIDQIMDSVGFLRNHLEMEAIDTEWVILSDKGPISLVALSNESYLGADITEISASFGIGASVVTSNESKVSKFLIPNRGEPQWGVMSKQAMSDFECINTKSIHLLQVRPYSLPLNKTKKISNLGDFDIKKFAYAKFDCQFLSNGSGDKQGVLIVENSIGEAWDSYLKFSSADKKKVAGVVVTEGNMLEHAGLMFNSQNISVSKLNKDEYVVLKSSISTTSSNTLVLPSSSSVIILHVNCNFLGQFEFSQDFNYSSPLSESIIIDKCNIHSFVKKNVDFEISESTNLESLVKELNTWIHNIDNMIELLAAGRQSEIDLEGTVALTDLLGNILGRDESTSSLILKSLKAWLSESSKTNTLNIAYALYALRRLLTCKSSSITGNLENVKVGSSATELLSKYLIDQLLSGGLTINDWIGYANIIHISSEQKDYYINKVLWKQAVENQISVVKELPDYEKDIQIYKAINDGSKISLKDEDDSLFKAIFMNKECVSNLMKLGFMDLILENFSFSAVDKLLNWLNESYYKGFDKSVKESKEISLVVSNLIQLKKKSNSFFIEDSIEFIDYFSGLDDLRSVLKKLNVLDQEQLSIVLEYFEFICQLNTGHSSVRILDYISKGNDGVFTLSFKEITDLINELVEDFKSLRKYNTLSSMTALHNNLTVNIAYIIIELIDLTAKMSAQECISGVTGSLEKYIEILSLWVSYVPIFNCVKKQPEISEVVQYFSNQLQAVKRTGNIDLLIDYELDWLEKIECRENVNIHELHNILHQYSLTLASNNLDYISSSKVSNLHNLMKQLGNIERRIYRNTSRFIELELGVNNKKYHKSSIIITPMEIKAQYTEAKYLKDSGRLYFLDYWFNLMNDSSDIFSNTSLIRSSVLGEEFSVTFRSMNRFNWEEISIISNLIRIIFDTTENSGGYIRNSGFHEGLMQTKEFKEFLLKLYKYMELLRFGNTQPFLGGDSESLKGSLCQHIYQIISHFPQKYTRLFSAESYDDALEIINYEIECGVDYDWSGYRKWLRDSYALILSVMYPNQIYNDLISGRNPIPYSKQWLYVLQRKDIAERALEDIESMLAPAILMRKLTLYNPGMVRKLRNGNMLKQKIVEIN